MQNKEVILDIYKSMANGTKFVEIETYLRNHTTLDEHALKVIRDNLSHIQRSFEDIQYILLECLNFCNE